MLDMSEGRTGQFACFKFIHERQDGIYLCQVTPSLDFDFDFDFEFNPWVN